MVRNNQVSAGSLWAPAALRNSYLCASSFLDAQLGFSRSYCEAGETCGSGKPHRLLVCYGKPKCLISGCGYPAQELHDTSQKQTMSCGLSPAHPGLWIPKICCKEQSALGHFSWLGGAPGAMRGVWPPSSISDPDVPRPGALDASPPIAPGWLPCEAVP